MDCRLICLDIDGTLLNSKHEITAHTKEIIKEAANMGIPIVLASARMPKAMRYIRDELELTSPISCFGGGLVLENEAIIFNRILNNQQVLRMYREADSMGIHTSLYREDGWYVERMDEWAVQEGVITHLRPEIVSFERLLDTWEGQKTGANKMMFMSEPDQIKALMNRLSEFGGDSVVMYRSKDTYLEVMPRGVGKKETVEFLCERYGIEPECVMAAGDNENDIGMIQAAGMGVAMGNASETVKVCADFVTKSNDEDGVAYAIEKFVLPRKVKLVAIDMDGTALQPDKTLSGVTFRAIERVNKQGVLVIPASGRTYAGIPKALLDMGLPYVISANGASVIDTKTGKRIYQNEIPFESTVRLLRELQQYDGLIYIQYEEMYYQDAAYVERAAMYHPYADLPEEGIVNDLMGLILRHQKPVQKVGILLCNEQMEQPVLELQESFPELKVLKTDHLSIEFNSASASKGEALKFLCEYLQTAPECVMAIGDNDNDVTMLTYAGISVAMGNASERAKQAASFITKGNDEFGAAWALNRFVKER